MQITTWQLIEERIEALLLRFEYLWEQPELAAEALTAAAYTMGRVTVPIMYMLVILSLFLTLCRLRHRQLIEECIEALLRFEYIWEQPELAAEELRAAAHALGKVTGVIDTEDVLDAIFSEFCIGK